MIKIVAENYIKEEYQEEFLKLTKELINSTGNVLYTLNYDKDEKKKEISLIIFIKILMMIVILLLLKNGKIKKQLMNIIKQNTLQQLFLKSKALLQNLQEQLNIKRCNNEYIRNNLFKKQC